MKCFNHEDREVVATCQRCGKGLCKECASKYSPCLCEECHAALLEQKAMRKIKKENDKKQKYLDALVDTKSEFIKTCIWGVVWAIILGSLVDYSFLGIVFFFLPFGWKLLTYLQSFIPITIIGSVIFWIVWIFMKSMLSIIIGIPAFVYQMIKSFWVQKEINETKEAIVYIDEDDDLDSMV